MIAHLIESFQNYHDPARLRAEVRRLRKLVDQLLLENAQLRRENRQLRRRLADADLRLLRQAETDAYLIGALHFAGQYTSRRACQEMGIGSRHWRRAVALLMVGRVHDGRRIDAATPDDWDRAIRIAKERIERDGMATLNLRQPLCYK